MSCQITWLWHNDVQRPQKRWRLVLKHSSKRPSADYEREKERVTCHRPFTLIRKRRGLLLWDFPLSSCLVSEMTHSLSARPLWSFLLPFEEELTALQMTVHLHKHGFVRLAYIIFRLLSPCLWTGNNSYMSNCFPSVCFFCFFWVVFVCSRSHPHSSSFVRMIKALI